MVDALHPHRNYQNKQKTGNWYSPHLVAHNNLVTSLYIKANNKKNPVDKLSYVSVINIYKQAKKLPMRLSLKVLVTTPKLQVMKIELGHLGLREEKSHRPRINPASS